jgi:DNA-binding PadR family transcriptional regulator
MLELSDCPCAGNTLDRLIQPAILVILVTGPLHGYRVAEQIQERLSPGDQKPDMSGVYRSLKAMERKGLVASSWEHAHAGPARKCYEITPDGERCLAQWIETIERYRDGINDLLRAARSAVRKRAET